MKIAYSRYELESKVPLNSRSLSLKRYGALLQVCFDDCLLGYADCHPWPELGDAPLDQQMALLAKGETTPILACALDWARKDAEARAEGRPMLLSSKIPKSHFLLPDIRLCTVDQVQRIVQQGFTHVKVKLGRQLDIEIIQLIKFFQDPHLKLRLDFNESLTQESFCVFLDKMDAIKMRVEFIEDPFPFEPKAWKSIQEQGWNLACDKQSQHALGRPESAKMIVIKPAIQRVGDLKIGREQIPIVTTYLGHPLGQVAAAAVAADLDPTNKYVHGLLSHHAYLPTNFSRKLNWDNPTFTCPEGHGLGFDQELKALTWTSL